MLAGQLRDLPYMAREGLTESVNSPAKPESSHVNDSTLQSFLASSFDPAEYLNSALPALSVGAIPPTAKQRDDASLAELTGQTQTLLSHLSANTARLSNILSQLADEIIRTGSRLAYEVEVLRGDALGLSEVLVEGLAQDVEKFVPRGLHIQKATGGDAASTPVKGGKGVEDDSPATPSIEDSLQGELEPDVPPYIARLRTLSTVKERLESVIKVFGDAMEWTLPPSEVSVTSSFISVSAPEPGSESYSQEEKGQAVTKKMREEIVGLAMSEGRDLHGVEAAQLRVQQLRELAKVWKGTAEEKARTRFVEGLAKLVEEKSKTARRERADRADKAALEREPHLVPAMSPSTYRRTLETKESSLMTDADPYGSSSRPGGYGLIDHLQRIRSGL